MNNESIHQLFNFLRWHQRQQQQQQHTHTHPLHGKLFCINVIRADEKYPQQQQQQQRHKPQRQTTQYK